VQSRPVGSSDRLDAGAQGWNIEDLIGSPLHEVSLFWFGTLLGPEGTAVWLSSSVPDRSAIAYRILVDRLVRINALSGEPVGV
jgi:hypothetical protein